MQNTTEEDKGRGQTATDVAAVWGAPLKAVHCAHCGETHLVPEPVLSDSASLTVDSAEREAIPSRCPSCLQGPKSRETLS